MKLNGNQNWSLCMHMNGSSLCSCDLACIHPSHKMDTEPMIPCICIKMDNLFAKTLDFVRSDMCISSLRSIESQWRYYACRQWQSSVSVMMIWKSGMQFLMLLFQYRVSRQHPTSFLHFEHSWCVFYGWGKPYWRSLELNTFQMWLLN